MNRLSNPCSTAAFAALLCLGLGALAVPAGKAAEPAVAEPAAVAKPGEASAKAATAADKPADPERSAHAAALAQINALGEKIEARRKAIVAENEAAAKISGEIADMAREVQKIGETMEARQAELGKMLDADKAMSVLNQEMAAAYESLRSVQMKRREEAVKRHRENLMLPEGQAPMAPAEKAGEGESK